MQRDLTPFCKALPEYQVSTEPRPDGEQLLILCDGSATPIYRRVMHAEMTDEQLISRIKLDLFAMGYAVEHDPETLLDEVKQQSYTTGEIHRTRWDRLWEERKLSTHRGRPQGR
ncbi:MAG: DUF3509 domain-containing protein [Halopseudomonas sp.]|uniref:DUF3509 domain-containing protein n=1 Tax=Halopseudomonas sp. TaxID=2901191 RepID=UPI003001EB54